MANATMAKFGYPGTLVAESEHWAVLLRPQAVTLGSLVLVATADATRYSDLPPAAFTEQGQVVARIGAVLDDFTGFQKLNYLMLMMVDPHVHFHVIPRYRGVRRYGGIDYPDTGWPKMPDFASARSLDAETRAAMLVDLRCLWTAEPGGA